MSVEIKTGGDVNYPIQVLFDTGEWKTYTERGLYSIFFQAPRFDIRPYIKEEISIVEEQQPLVESVNKQIVAEPEIKLVRSHIEIAMPNGDSYKIDVTKNAIYINLQSDNRSLMVRPCVSNEVALSAVEINYTK